LRYIHNTQTDPAFNLAAEEWLLRHSDQDVFMLWRNTPCVIVGRNQNSRAQINEAYVRAHHLPVIRRLSGGGAVFHDLGNVNFTFLNMDHTAGSNLDFLRFTTPVIEALRSMGLNCAFDGRNDLTLDGCKISGNAQHVSGNRVLHHGTLLFSTELINLSSALRIDRLKYRDKAVKSVSSRVTNIAKHLPSPGMGVQQFMNLLMTHMSGGAVLDSLTLNAEEREGIETLVREKYATWEWNFGHTVAYGFTRASRTEGGMVEAHLDVRAGHIEGARLMGDYFGECDIAELESLLVGCRHERAALAERLRGVPLEIYLRGVSLAAFLDCLF